MVKNKKKSCANNEPCQPKKKLFIDQKKPFVKFSNFNYTMKNIKKSQEVKEI